jgi:hypothetical protein
LITKAVPITSIATINKWRSFTFAPFNIPGQMRGINYAPFLEHWLRHYGGLCKSPAFLQLPNASAKKLAVHTPYPG